MTLRSLTFPPCCHGSCSITCSSRTRPSSTAPSASTRPMMMKMVYFMSCLLLILQCVHFCPKLEGIVLTVIRICCSLDEDNSLLPSSLRLLNTAHEYLGRRSWCCNSDGALLKFFVSLKICWRWEHAFVFQIYKHFEYLMLVCLCHRCVNCSRSYLKQMHRCLIRRIWRWHWSSVSTACTPTQARRAKHATWRSTLHHR